MVSDRGLRLGSETRFAASPTDFATNRAYVIGINEYSHGIPPLRTAAADAARLAEILESSHDYQVRLFPRDAPPSFEISSSRAFTISGSTWFCVSFSRMRGVGAKAMPWR